MNEENASKTAIAPRSAATARRPVASNATDGAKASQPPSRTTSGNPSRWTTGRVVSLAIGVLLAILALGLLTAGGTGLWADTTQRSNGYVTTDAKSFSAGGSALVTEPVDLGSAGVAWLYSPALLDKVRIRVTPSNPGSRLFVGIGPSAAADRYLAGVNHSVVSDFFGGKTQVVAGGPARTAPGKQSFWVASTAGPGARSLVWSPKDGSWSVVVMNSSGRPGLTVSADLGGRFPNLLWITIGLLIAGAVLLTGAAFLIFGAIRRDGTPTPTPQPTT